MASFAEQLQRAAETFDLSDQDLANLFKSDLTTAPVVGEWRAGRSDTRLPRMSDIYLVKTLDKLATSFEDSGLERSWLYRPGSNGQSPQEQVRRGRFLRVQAAIDGAVSAAKATSGPRSRLGN